MAYITPADFRPSTRMFPDIQITTSEAGDTRLTTEIATQSAEFDRITGDHFETVSSATIDFLNPRSTTLVTRGYRLQSLTSIAELTDDGTSNTLTATTYYLRPWGVVKTDGYPFGFYGERTVRLAGVSYGWTACPGSVKRAVALMVFDVLKSKSVDRMRATRWRTGDTIFERDIATESLTGIPEADEIAGRFRSLWRPRILAV